MGLELIPQDVRDKFTIEERGHACAILAADYPNELKDIIDCLRQFSLPRSHIVAEGGARSLISKGIDGFFLQRGWTEKQFNIRIEVDGGEIPIPTHHIDNYRNRVGIEVEWNNKTEFYDRDLNNFRLLKDLRVLSVGVIITRLTELLGVIKEARDSKTSSGASTTHWNKLIPKVDGGGAGCCPLLLIGMGKACYDCNA